MNILKKHAPSFLLMSVAIVTFSVATLAADDQENKCEVMKVEGGAFLVSGSVRSNLKQGDILKAGDVVEVDTKSSVDLAYDKEWKNVSKINENSRVKIMSIYPTKLVMVEGDIYAKLHALPKGSSFEIKTPTAVAAVRGSEYRTVCRNRVTKVYNFSRSDVEVYGLGSNGKPLEDTLVRLKNTYKTSILDRGLSPKEPEVALKNEMEEGNRLAAAIDKRVEEAKASGVVSQIQSVAEAEIREEEAKNPPPPPESPMPSEQKNPDQTNAAIASEDAIDETLPSITYSIVSIQSSGSSDVSFYDFASRRADLLQSGAAVQGDDSMVCIGENSEVVIAADAGPGKEPQKKVIKGPINGLLENLFNKVDDSGHVKTEKKQKGTTTIAIQEGAIQTSILFKDKKGQEVPGPVVLIKGAAQKEEGVSSKETSGENFKPGANFVLVNACSYVKPLYVPNLDLDKTSAADLTTRYKKGINLDEEFLPADLY